jgi:hypothetical protein
VRPTGRLALAVLAVATGALLGCGEAREGPSAPGLDPPYPVRGIYGSGLTTKGRLGGLVRTGFNVIDSGPYRKELDRIAARRVKAFVWLGGYSNESCQFRESDHWVRSHVRAISGHRAVRAYFIDDEPDAARCPEAPAQIAARSALVKRLDPEPQTFIVTYHVDQLRLFAGTVDVIGLDHYPCTLEHGCDFTRITEQAAEADRLGIRYWGVIQAHGDDWYKLPTPAELREQFEYWRATAMEGYLVFAWNWPEGDRSAWLANRPELRRQLSIENRAAARHR